MGIIERISNNDNSTYFCKNRTEIKNMLSSLKCKDKVVILKFYATWCNPCKTATTILEEVLDNYKGKQDILVIEYDVDKYDDIASHFKVQSLPTIITFYNGEKKEILCGVTKEYIELLIENTC